MSVAAQRTLKPSDIPAAASPRPAFARVEVFEDPTQALDVWRALSPESCGSFYQSETFILSWLESVAAHDKARPFFVVARDEAGASLTLLPLGLFRFGPLRVAQFLGGKHSNYNLGLFRGDRLFSARDLKALLRAAAQAAREGPHLYRLSNLPPFWREAANPLVLLPHRPAASRAYATRLDGDGEAFLAARFSPDARKKMRKKEKRLAGMGVLRHVRAETAAQAEHILDAYFAHRDAHPDAHVAAAADQSTRAFYRALARRAGGRVEVEFHALSLDDRMIATFGAGLCGGRLQGMFISYDSDPEIAKSSPGELLLCHVVLDACARNFSAFDLGAGDARYKTGFCDEAEPLVEALYAPTLIGRLASPLFIAASAAKAAIKRDPRLFALAKRWLPR